MHIEDCQFGSIIIDGKKYCQVLMVSNEVLERDEEKLNRLFSTTHHIGDWETAMLITDKPEYIIVGTGQSGAMEVDPDTEHQLKELSAKLIIKPTPEAIKQYNQLSQEHRVNALIHTTC